MECNITFSIKNFDTVNSIILVTQVNMRMEFQNIKV